MSLSRRCCIALSWIAFLLAATPASAVVDVMFEDGFEFGFHVQSPEITLAPGEEATYCYFFRTPNSTALGVRRWRSHALGGMHHAILFTTINEKQPPGTLTQNNCSTAPGGELGKWQYAAYGLDDALEFPSDDGTATPLAAEIGTGQFAFLQMYALNTSDQALTTSVYLSAQALDPATVYTKSATYMSYNSNLLLPPISISTAEQTCATPAGSKFWRLSSRTHRYATMSKIINAGSDVVVSLDWEHPAVATFSAPGFLTFGSGMTYHCEYYNPGSVSVHSGDSESTDEVCMGIGYFFPADTGAKICINNTGPL